MSLGMSLYLYRITVSSTRNLRWRIANDGTRYRPPIPLDAHFLVTAWASDPIKQQRMLGFAIRTLEDTPILPSGILNQHAPEPEVFRPEETVELVFENVSTQDQSYIWEVAQTKEQPSATYVARMIEIDSTVAADAMAPRHRAAIRPRSGGALMSCTVQLDHVVREAVLGVSFWDSVTGRVAAEGLEVREISSGTYARTTPSNVYVFNHLPGLRTWGDPIVWSSPPGRRLTFAVTDRDRRFIPFRFAAEVPQPLLFVPSCIVGGSPPATGQSIPLFSSPSRPVQPGFAAIRADLWDVLADAPAAGAVLEVLGVNTSPWFGVADWRGRVVVQCPYPEPGGRSHRRLPAAQHSRSKAGLSTWPSATHRVGLAPRRPSASRLISVRC